MAEMDTTAGAFGSGGEALAGSGRYWKGLALKNRRLRQTTAKSSA